MAQKENRVKYLLQNTVIFAFGNIATRLISFFLVPIYTNVLSTTEYGIIDTVFTVCTLLAPVISLNIMEGIMRFALIKNADHNKIMSVGLICFLFAIVAALLIIPLANTIPAIAPYTVYMYCYVVLFSGSQIFLAYLRGKEQLLQYSIGNIINTVCIAVFNIYYLVVLHQGIAGYFKAYIWASAITMLYAFYVGNVKEVIHRFHLDRQIAGQMIRYSAVLIPNSFMWWITNSSDRLMISAMVGAAANGLYAVSYKLPTLIQVVTNIFNQAWSYSAIHENDSEDRDEYFNQIFNVVFMIATLSAVGLLAIIKPFMRIYVADIYYDAWRYVPYLAVGFVYSTVATFLGTSYTVNIDGKGYLCSATCGAGVNLVLNLLLIPGMGVSGAALATCLSYISVFVYRYVDTQKYVSLVVFSARNLAATCILVLTAVTVYWDSPIGAVLLWLELTAELILFRNVWMPMFCEIKKKVLSKRKRGSSNDR